MNPSAPVLTSLALPLGLAAGEARFLASPAGDTRVVAVEGADLAHTTQVCAAETEESPAETCLDRLDALLREAGSGLDLVGSDWMHLVKATYFGFVRR